MTIFLAICLVWGSNFILMHRATLAFSPLAISFWRLLLGGGVLMVCWFWSERRRISRRDWPHLAVVGLLGNALPFTLLAMLISRGFGHSFFAMLMGFVPLLTIVVSAAMLTIWPTPRQLAGVLGGLAALAILLWDGTTRGMSTGTLIVAFCVPAAYATANTYLRWKLTHAPVLLMTALVFLLGAAMVWPVWAFAPAGTSFPPASPHDGRMALASLLWLGIVGTGLAGLAFIRLIQTHGPLYAGMVTYLIPLIALGWGAYDAEPISFPQLLAMATVVAMVALVQGRLPGWRKDRSPRVVTEES